MLQAFVRIDLNSKAGVKRTIIFIERAIEVNKYMTIHNILCIGNNREGDLSGGTE